MSASRPGVAIVGLGARYPDARTPEELWENVLAQRRAFRRIPSERLRVADYVSRDRAAPDVTYSDQAAVIEGYGFDRVRFRVAGSTYRSGDLAHWLALDVASQALADAGFPEAAGLDRETTGVLLGNTLTGEFSRANSMRLRWPYVRRVVEAGLLEADWSAGDRREFLRKLESRYKNPFPPVGEETLAGGLSNTIAGRICNAYNLQGGGYTVDGACAASLLAVIHACGALVAGDLDVALAGGVDLSLDPFELVGFAKTGALAPELMRIYDARSAGFWPGEGCGFLVLMREADAVAQGRRIYAVLRGWGVSSDGAGGITRPEVGGQSLAVRRAYRRAGFEPGSVSYMEGHGTGTEVGDATEIQVLAGAHGRSDPPAALGSVKANIGHTKAAAGVAGLIKATMAVHRQVLPPTTGCETPHPLFAADASNLRILRRGEPWPPDRLLRASVSAMGFGGINTHLLLEGIAERRGDFPTPREAALLASPQDAELLAFSAPDLHGLTAKLERLLAAAPGLSLAEVGDLAAALAAEPEVLPQAGVRAAVVASSPAELTARFETLREWIEEGTSERLDLDAGVFLGRAATTPRIGFLFPGQGSPAHLDGGVWRRRFRSVDELYARTNLRTEGDGVATEIAQPAICTASLAGLAVLDDWGIRAEIAVGHSLGELTAYHWGGAYDADALLRIARARGEAMATLGSATGAMAGIPAPAEAVEPLLEGVPVVLAGLNAPHQTVVSGERTAVETVVGRARARGLHATLLPVSHAFHSPLVEKAAAPLARHLAAEAIRPLRAAVASTIRGGRLNAEDDLVDLLVQQVTHPVRFREAVRSAAEGADLLIEVGPGSVLGRLARQNVSCPVVSIDAGGASLRGLLLAAGASFALGASTRVNRIFADRFLRPFDLDRRPQFFRNPCEEAPVPDSEIGFEPAEPTPAEPAAPGTFVDGPGERIEETASVLELVRRLVADRAELPPQTVEESHNLLGDLHLNSISVGQIVVEAAKRLGLPPPVAPTEFAGATVAGLARALEELRAVGATRGVVEAGAPAGVDAWIRSFTIVLRERLLPDQDAPVPSPAKESRSSDAPAGWRIYAAESNPLRANLEEALNRDAPRTGVALCLPPDPGPESVELMLEAAHRALDTPGAAFLLIQHGGGGGGFARTFFLEDADRTTTVVDVPEGDPEAISWIVAEARAADGFTEARYDGGGVRRVPVLELLPPPGPAPAIPLAAEDVLLVTGGGKGIASECALGIAERTGLSLALVGRSAVEDDPALASNLERFRARGIRFRYYSCDVTVPDAVAATIARIRDELGPVTAFLHGAGSNVPRLLRELDPSAFRRTLSAKVGGAENVLRALDPERLKLFLAFGSLIARAGLQGESDYAVANEWLSRLVEKWGREHPACRCLSLEWSVWSGLGMGERLGRVEALARRGIAAIPPDAGTRICLEMLERELPASSVVVTGRFGSAPTLDLDAAPLPLLRFLESPRIQVPGVELITEFRLTVDTDPYLADHVYQGDVLFPAVLGLEAMAQAARGVTGRAEIARFEKVEFNQPIVVPEDGGIGVRVAALALDADRVQVALRCEATGYGVNHFAAVCRLVSPDVTPANGDRPGDPVLSMTPGNGDRPGEPAPGGSPDPAATPEEADWDGFDSPGTNGETSPIPLDPSRDLYGGILFHRGRFRRLKEYRLLRSKACVAEIGEAAGDRWFGRYLPGELVLGDPAARDGALHAVQVCIPQATLLPTGVDALEIRPGRRERSFVHARERKRDGELFVYDLVVRDETGEVRERWSGLRLKAMKDAAASSPWPAPLLGPYLERRLEELGLDAALSVAVECGRSSREERSRIAKLRAAGVPTPIARRADGKPDLPLGPQISVSHHEGLTLAVCGDRTVGCDVERVSPRPVSTWHDLLGAERWSLAQVVAGEAGEDESAAATRLWSAVECLKKAGISTQTPLILGSCLANRWVVFHAGNAVVATWIASVRGFDQPLGIAVSVGDDPVDVRPAPGSRAR